MREPKTVNRAAIVLFAIASVTTLLMSGSERKPERGGPPVVPGAWDDKALESLEVPLVEPSASPVHISSDYYYRISVRPIYKNYPVYRPDKEPPGYMDWLKRQEPKVVFEPSKLKSEEDWIKAGEIVYDAPIDFDPKIFVSMSMVRDLAWYEKVRIPLARDGTMPFARYVIRVKGKVELGIDSCATCHTRVMPDGTVIKGAQGNFPYGPAEAFGLRALAAELDNVNEVLKANLHERRLAFGVPWQKPDPLATLEEMPFAELVSGLAAVPPGVAERVNTSFLFPPQIPDLVGVKDRRYFDHTGLVRQRTIGDLMRYVALVQGAVRLDRFLNFRTLPQLPDPSALLRYSDEQLYALALYLYSLQPPPNPNTFNALAARGQEVFEREGCAQCHTPPLYTNNKLTPVEGFTPPEDHLRRFDILPICVGTDPYLALRTRKGTGYYKVPSLRGVWYRGPFEHNGSVATLEDWFDPRRTRDDYVPTGFRGFGMKARAIRGHPFGLDLSEEDRKALVAFLKTL